MTASEAIYQFFSGFDLPAYAEASVPKEAEPPYLTYQETTAFFGENCTSITVKLWYYGESEKPANDKAEELGRAIGAGGVMLHCDGGAVWLKRGSPWSQSVTGGTDDWLRGRYINVTAEFLTT